MATAKKRAKSQKQKAKAKPKAKPRASVKGKKQQPSKATLARRRAARIEREAIKESILASERARARREARDRREREAKLERRRQRQQRRAALERRAVAQPILEHLIGIFEYMQKQSPVPVGLQIEPAPPGRSLWLLCGQFIFTDATPTYLDLHEMLATWEDDLALEAEINPQRLTMIRVHYQPVRGESAWYTVADASSWSYAISTARHECSPDDEDSLSNRYAETVVKEIHVYFSEQTAQHETITI